MGKLIAIGPDGRAQAPTRSDDFRAVIEQTLALGMLDQLQLSPRCRSHDHADHVRRGLYRSARYFCSCGDWVCTRKWGNVPREDAPLGGCPDGGQRISCRADVVFVRDEDGRRHYHVQFRLHDKREAVLAVVKKYGPDTSKWPYFARRKKLKEKR